MDQGSPTLGAAAITFQVMIPQLDGMLSMLTRAAVALERLGVIMSEAADRINQRLDELVQAVDQEATEIADELRRLNAGTMTTEEVEAIAARMDGMAVKIRGYVTPAVPEPTPPQPA